MAVPRIFCLQGQTPQTFTGISRIQTGFLVGRFVFTPISFPGGGNCPPCPPAMYGPGTALYWKLLGNVPGIFDYAFLWLNHQRSTFNYVFRDEKVKLVTYLLLFT